MLYGIHDEQLGWLTRDGSVITSKDPEKLRETIPFGSVRRLGLRQLLGPRVELDSAFQKGRSSVRLHRTTERGVDFRIEPLPMCGGCLSTYRDTLIEAGTPERS